MTDKTAASPIQKATAPKPELAEPVDPRIEAAQRAHACGKAVEAVLTEHGCRIAAYLQAAEPVGNDGSKAMISAAFGIFPNPTPET